MFDHIIGWTKERFMVLGGMIIGFSGVVWLGTLFVKYFMRRQINYAWDAAETTPLLVICGVLLWSLAYQTIQCLLSREAAVSVVLGYIAPWVLIVSTASMAIWMLDGPSKGANFLPLLTVIAVSGLSGYVVWYGFLSDRGRLFKTKIARHSDEESQRDIARVTVPTVSFKDIHGNEALKRRLLEAATAVTAPRSSGATAPRNGVLMHGGPGNGKTILAEALAGELRLPFLQLAIGDVSSKWVGEKTDRIRQSFEQAIRAQPCLLFIDEIDSLLESRDGDRGDGVKEDRDVVNALLTMLVDIRKTRVLVVAATNHMDRLDSAGIREGRFDFKVEITPPDEAARIGLLTDGLRKALPKARVDVELIRSVARRWNGFSVKRILAVTEEMPNYLQGRGAITFDDFMGALRVLQGQRGADVVNAKEMNELVLAPETREALDLIVGRLADPEHTERYGGTLPTGVLFYGPPGTGKTAACKAIAKAIGWGFLPVNGADMARNPKELEKLFAKAKELRPTIIFVDEADDLLKSREFSGNTEATNKLLTLMDGIEDRVTDVVWIAATNHPEQIDAALLRGGRFTEKVPFSVPTEDQLAVHLARWLEARKVQLAPGATPAMLAERLGATSIANAEAVAQSAVNRAIVRREVPVVLTETDIEHATRLVTG